MLEFLLVDAGVGNVTIEGNEAETTNDAATHVLTKQKHFLKFYSDRANLKIRGKNKCS